MTKKQVVVFPGLQSNTYKFNRKPTALHIHLLYLYRCKQIKSQHAITLNKKKSIIIILTFYGFCRHLYPQAIVRFRLGNPRTNMSNILTNEIAWKIVKISGTVDGIYRSVYEKKVQTVNWYCLLLISAFLYIYVHNILECICDYLTACFVRF